MKKIFLLIIGLLLISQPQLWAAKVYTIGDSTMSNRSDSSKEQGWATFLQTFFEGDAITVSNHAVAGRSTKSFLSEGRWTPIVNALLPGDYVIIQFGHNDQKVDDPDLGTDPNGLYRDNLRKFISETKRKGATPILMTSIVRRIFENGVLTNSLGVYPDAVREVASEEKVILIDMEKKSRKLVESLGDAGSKSLYMVSAGKPTDNTHFTRQGAIAMAGLAAEGFYEARIPLVKYMKRTAVIYDPLKELSIYEFFDETDKLVNPSFDENTQGWTDAETGIDGGVEVRQKVFNMSQTLSGLKPGTYSLKVQGFDRYKANDGGKLFKTGMKFVYANLYAQTAQGNYSTPFNSIYEWTYSGEGNSNGYAHTMAHAQELFRAGYYEVELFNIEVGNDGVLTFGVESKNTLADSWVVFDNFRLYYYGQTKGTSFQQPVGNVFDLRIEKHPNGFYVCTNSGEGSGDITLYSLSGNRISTSHIVTDKTYIPVPVPGVYLSEVIIGNNRKVCKVLVTGL